MTMMAAVRLLVVLFAKASAGAEQNAFSNVSFLEQMERTAASGQTAHSRSRSRVRRNSCLGCRDSGCVSCCQNAECGCAYFRCTSGGPTGTCKPGFYFDSTNHQCIECEANTYQPEESFSGSLCVPQPACGAGMRYVEPLGRRNKERVCIPLQPLPPNTGMTLVADVAGTIDANDTFWAVACKKIPSNTLFVVLDMSAVRDFFRPVDGASYCEMLLSHDKHQWSTNGVDWFEIEFDGYSGSNGGSAVNWPRNAGRIGDERAYLSFWGRDGGWTGGCCSSSTAAAGHTNWGYPYTLSYAVQLQPLPPNTGVSLVADVAGTTKAGDTFWTEKCKKIHPNTLFIVVDMGAVRIEI